MDKQNYKPRVIDAKVKEYLSAFGAVCIEGPKWCGKTWTSSYHSKSEIYIGDPANNFQNRQLAELSPALVLEGDTPRLIDEWQEVPSISIITESKYCKYGYLLIKSLIRKPTPQVSSHPSMKFFVV